MLDTYYEIVLQLDDPSPGCEEMLTGILAGLGIDPLSLSITLEQGRPSIKFYCETLGEAERLAGAIRDFRMPRLTVAVQTLATPDWRDKWKDDLKPFALTGHLDVVPAWQTHAYQTQPKRRPIYLDTTLAFGTGLHETTRFSAQMIEGLSGTFTSFLDIGTGTGLLAMVAAFCGARELWALDIDPCCLPMAKKNLARNGLAFDWCEAMDFRSFERRRRFDLVAANVMTDELIAMRSDLAAAVVEGGHLIVSGISLENLPRLLDAFADQPLIHCETRQGKTWSAILWCRQ